MDPYIQFRSGNVSSMGELITSEGEANSSQLNDNSDDSNQKKKRGPTQMHSIWGTHDGKRFQVSLNEYGQPNDEMGSKLSLFIGTIVRDGKNAPLIYKDWHQVPSHYKDNIWALVQSKFDLPNNAKTWAMKLAGKKLKDWKTTLKSLYYKEYLSFEEQKQFKDERVYAGQWEQLIRYWGSEEVKARSEKNKASRSQRKYNHATGSKSFPRVRSEQKKKLQRSPTRVEMFKICYSKNDGTPNSEATGEIMAQMDERTNLDSLSSEKRHIQSDVFAQVMGKERNGSVRMYGFGVSPSDLQKDIQCHETNDMQRELVELRSKIQQLESLLLNARPNSTSTSEKVPNALNAHDLTTQYFMGSATQRQFDTLTEVGDTVVIKSIMRPEETVAIGVLRSIDPSKEVNGEDLGPNFWEVLVQVPIKPDESLMRTYGQYKTIGQAVGAHIAWPAPFVISKVVDDSREYLYQMT